MNKPFTPQPILPILANVGISISDLKKNPAAAIEAAKVEQVAILNRNKAVAYLISPEVWDHIMDVFEDQKFAREFGDRLDDPLEDSIAVSLDDLV
jgi:antitoxin StbD